MNKVSVLGAGSFGTAISGVFSDGGAEVTIYCRNEERATEMEKDRTNSKYLKDYQIRDGIKITTDPKEALKDCDLAVIAISTQKIRQFLEENKEYIDKNTMVLSLAKGLELGTGLRVSEIYQEVVGQDNFAVLSGPSHAEEVAQNLPTAVVSSSKNIQIAKKVQHMAKTEYFRVYTNQDLVGVELGGALKNIIAIGSGIIEGKGYKDNTKAGLITRGLHEIAKLGEKLGAKRSTFSGLSGIGDLVVTCMSHNSRNLRYGMLRGKGMDHEKATQEVKQVVEGIPTTKVAYELAQKYAVSMPITEEIYKFIYKGQELDKSIKEIMGRSVKPENEEAEEELDMI